MHSLAIIGLCVGSAVLYGVLHDQITARICVEYFTIGHPRLFGTEDPTLLGVAWGIVATWWAGALLGVPMALAARVGGRPKRDAGSLVRPILCLLAVMGLCAFLAGAVGGFLGSRGTVVLTGSIASAVPLDRHVPFLIDLWAHSASYAVGFIGGCILIASVWRSRGSPASAPTGRDSTAQGAGTDRSVGPLGL
jgi:hypothetical protein